MEGVTALRTVTPSKHGRCNSVEELLHLLNMEGVTVLRTAREDVGHTDMARRGHPHRRRRTLFSTNEIKQISRKFRRN